MRNKNEKEGCIKIHYNLGYKNQEEEAHVRENVEKESVMLVNLWKKVKGTEKYSEI